MQFETDKHNEKIRQKDSFGQLLSKFEDQLHLGRKATGILTESVGCFGEYCQLNNIRSFSL